MDEHARFAEFIARLAVHDRISVGFALECVRWAESDPDHAMAQAAVVRLIQHPGMDEDVLIAIERAIPAGWGACLDHLRERRLRLPLESPSADERDVMAAALSGSRRLQLWLLDERPLSQDVLRALASDGATTAIRNRARQRLRR